MKIKILGTRAHIKEWKPGHRKHSGVLIDDIILLDLGEEEFLEFNPEIILITHLHPDHAFFIQDEINLKVHCPVYLPESSKLVAYAEIIEAPIQWKNYKIIPVPTLHSKYVKSQGYSKVAPRKLFLFIRVPGL